MSQKFFLDLINSLLRKELAGTCLSHQLRGNLRHYLEKLNDRIIKDFNS